MLTSDTLLRTIARLQRGIPVAQGRRLLLDYLRKSAGARLCLLFLVDREQQRLLLLERLGRRPALGQPPSPSSGPRSNQQRRKTDQTAGRQLDSEQIPLNGLFGSALSSKGPLYISTIPADPRSLREEQYWLGHDGYAIISAVGQPGMRQGVLVLCFGPREGQTINDIQNSIDEGSFLVCIALLSTYLFEPAPSHKEKETGVVIDAELSRIARDIHDGIAQDIAHIIHRLEFIQRTFEKQPELALREVGRAQEMLKSSLHKLRYDISSLLPAHLKEQGFAAALQELLRDYAGNEPGLQLSTDIEEPCPVPSSLEEPIFRLLQEALNNVRKHAHASKVTIRISSQPGLLVVQVSDNGAGFHVEQSGDARQHFGLRMMRERVQQVGGSLEIKSRPNKGVTIKTWFPLGTAPAELTTREREVLRLLADGATNRAIAEELSVSVETIKSHVHHIMQKMHANDRTQAAVMATRQRWL